MKQSREAGFTLIELISVVVLLFAATLIFFMQQNDLAASNRDTTRKTAINAMYYNLQEVYFAKNQAYPEKIDATTLTGIDPAILKDPANKTVNEEGSTYRYEGQNCTDGRCNAFELRALLEKEADFVKKNQ